MRLQRFLLSGGLSYYDAHSIMFFALSLFGSAIVIAEYFWLWRDKNQAENGAL